MRRGPANQT